MWLRALLLCDDVRLEAGGTLTAVGIHGEHVRVLAGPDPIVLPKLVVLAIVWGLEGVERFSWRHSLAPEDGPPVVRPTLREEPHDPTATEHRLVTVLSPVQFGGAGRYRLSLELVAGRERHGYELPFEIVRLPPPAEGTEP